MSTATVIMARAARMETLRLARHALRIHYPEHETVDQALDMLGNAMIDVARGTENLCTAQAVYVANSILRELRR
jgi:hypothetical protein